MEGWTCTNKPPSDLKTTLILANRPTRKEASIENVTHPRLGTPPEDPPRRHPSHKKAEMPVLANLPIHPHRCLNFPLITNKVKMDPDKLVKDPTPTPIAPNEYTE